MQTSCFYMLDRYTYPLFILWETQSIEQLKATEKEITLNNKYR